MSTKGGWSVRALSECGRLLSGGTPSKARPEYWNGTLPWFSSKEIKAFSLLDSELHVSADGAHHGSSLVPQGTVLFVVRGMSLASEFRVGVTTSEATFNQDVKAIIPNSDVEPRYLARCLRWLEPRVLGDAEESSHGTKRIPGHVFENLEIPVPPMSEQRRIADMLDRADAIRRKCKKAITLSEDLLRSAFLSMVGPGAEDHRQWPVSTIGSLALCEKNSMRTGPFGSDLRHSEFTDHGIAVIGIDNVVTNRFQWAQRRFISSDKYEDLKRYTVRPGDVLVTIMGTIGRTAVVPEGIPLAITTKHLAAITLDRTRAEPEFVAHTIRQHPDNVGQIQQADRGAIMSGLNLGVIRSLTIRVPPVATQRKFAEAVSRIESFRLNALSAAAGAEEMFTQISEDLFSRGGAGRRDHRH